MKNLFLLFLGVLFVLFFSSCKHDPVSISDPSLMLETYDDGLSVLNYYDNNFKVRAQLPTDFGDSVDVKITSDTDTEGFVVRVKTVEASYEEDNQEYLYLCVNETFLTANYTDINERFIKVGGSSDNIHATINGISEEGFISIEGNEIVSVLYDSLEVAGQITAEISLNGHNFSGVESFELEVWTDKDNTAQIFQMTYDDPENDILAFSSFSVSLILNKNGDTDGQVLGIDDNQQVYIKYNNKVFISVFEENTFTRLPQQ